MVKKTVKNTPEKKLVKATAKVAPAKKASTTPQEGAVPPTLSHIIGEIFWLLLQSPGHKHLAIRDAEWFFLPAIANRQARLFHADGRPVGLAMWAYVSEEVEKEKFIDRQGKLRPDEWNSGDRAWLVEIIAPFPNKENNLPQTMIAELMKGPLKGKKLSIRKTNTKTGKSEVVEIKG